jgi:hypothetical protein
MRLGVIALLTALSIASTAAAQKIRNPRQTTWRGTLTTTAGLTGKFIARTHLTYGRDLDTVFYGRLRCRGAGCPVPHGRIALTVDGGFPPKGNTIIQVIFGLSRQTYCEYDNNEPPPNFLVVGAYQCYALVQHQPFAVWPLISSGTLNLVAYQNGRPVPPSFHAPPSS